MSPILISLLLLGGIGFLFGILLAYAGKKFAVEVDPRVEEIEGILPGANCGACGYPGCRGLAEAIVAGQVQVNACPAGGTDVADKIAAVMGAQTSGGPPMRAVVLCRGGREECPDRFIYQGVQDCVAAHHLAGGPKGCEYGCLGLGTCVAKCPFGAIRINEKGLAEVGPDCTGCGICVDSCPRGLIQLVPADKVVVINKCRNIQRGPEVRKICKVGCIGCGICVKNCPHGAISIVDNVAVIDQNKCAQCNECMKHCPILKVKPKPAAEKKEEAAKEPAGV